MTSLDPWKTLGLSPDAEPDAVRKAYRQCIKRHKPETDPEGFRAVREAYDAALPLAEQNAWRAQARASASVSAPSVESVEGVRADEPVEPVQHEPHPLADYHARFDALEPEDSHGRLELAREALNRFPQLEDARFLYEEALYEVEDPLERRALMVDAYRNRLPGAVETLLFDAPSQLDRGDLVEASSTGSIAVRAQAMVELARRDLPVQAMELARELRAIAHEEYAIVNLTQKLTDLGLELFAHRHRELGAEVVGMLRELDVESVHMRGVHVSPRRVYLAELATLGRDVADAEAADLALLVVDEAERLPRMAMASGRTDYGKLRRKLKKKHPALEALALRELTPVAQPGSKPVSRGSWTGTGAIILVLMQVLRALVNCDTEPTTPSERGAPPAAVHSAASSVNDPPETSPP